MTDFAPSVEIKTKLRRYKPELGWLPRERDGLPGRASSALQLELSATGSLDPGPVAEPFYVTPDKLPDHIFVIGCELDMLGHEGWRQISRLAGRRMPRMDEPIGRQETVGEGELILDDERFHFEKSADGKRYRWLLVPDVVHGFDQKIESMVRDPVLMKDGRIKTQKTIELIGQWLLEGPLGP